MNRIKELRKEKAITVKELSKIIGISQSMLSNYENGNSEPRDKETWQKLADYFGVSVAYLRGFDEENAFSNIDSEEVLHHLLENAKVGDDLMEKIYNDLSLQITSIIEDIFSELRNEIKQNEPNIEYINNNIKNLYRAYISLKNLLEQALDLYGGLSDTFNLWIKFNNYISAQKDDNDIKKHP